MASTASADKPDSDAKRSWRRRAAAIRRNAGTDSGSAAGLSNYMDQQRYGPETFHYTNACQYYYDDGLLFCSIIGHGVYLGITIGLYESDGKAAVQP